MRDRYVDLYLRISHGRPGAGLDVQERDCREWAERHGLTVRAVHVDLGRSGFNETVERHGFEAALTAVTSGVVGTLVVWKLDRLSRRGVAHLHRVLNELDTNGGRLVSVKDSLDSSDHTSRVVMEKLAELAFTESENLSLRVRSAKQYLRANGRWIGGAASYGLVVKDGRLAVDPATGPTVREMARRILNGETLSQVTAWLNSAGIAAPRGGQWNVGSVSQLIRGPATAGLLPETLKNASGAFTAQVQPWRDPQTGETVSVMAEGEEPLIFPADRDRIVALLEARSAWWSAKRGSSTSAEPGGHLLTGLLRCAGCGSRMSKNGNSYRCQAVRIGRPCAAPGGAYKSALEEAISRRWNEKLAALEAGDPLAEEVVHRWMSARSPRESAQLAVLNKAVAQDRDTLAQIDEDHHIHGTLTREDHELLALPLAASITELERRIDELFPCADDPWSLISLADLRSDFANAGVVQRRELLRFALDEVWVSQGIRGQRFDDGARLAFVWATSPPTVTGDNDLLVAAAKQRIGARRS
jgi:site-specific DNA recombinase